VSTHHSGPVPEESDKSPRQRPGYRWSMYEVGARRMTEVEHSQVEEVQDEHELANPEQASDPQKDECELEDVIEDEVTSDIGSSSNVSCVGREEVPDISDL